MKFERIKARAIGPFHEIDLDLDAIPGRLVAVTGANGAGKSTLLELLAGGMFRATPTRGSLADLATARDAMLEVGVRNGRSYTLRHAVDAVSKKSEAIALDASGRTLTDAGKVRELDAWVASHLPSPEVLYSSTFAPQGSGGFLELKPAERKRVLLRVLGIERLEALAEAARKRAASAKESLRLAETRLEDEAARTTPLDAAESEVADAREALATAEAALADAEKRARDAERAADAQARALEERKTLAARIERLDDAILLAVRRRADARALADRAPEIENARADEPRLAAEHNAAIESLADAAAKFTSAKAHAAQVRAIYEAQARDRARVRAIEAELTASERRLADLEREIAAAPEIDAARAEVVALTESIRADRERLDRLRAQLTAAEAEHADRRARAYARDAESGELRRRLAALDLRDAGGIRAAAADLPVLEQRVADARNAVPSLEAELAEAREARLTVSERRIGGLRSALESIRDSQLKSDMYSHATEGLVHDDEIRDAAADAPFRIASKEVDLDRVRRELATREETLALALRLADRLPALERAEAEHAALTAQLEARVATIYDDVLTLETAANALAFARGVIHDLAEAVQIAEGRLAQARRVADRAGDVAGARAAAEALREAMGKLEGERAELLARPVADFTDPQAEIDSAERAVHAATAKKARAADALTLLRSVLADADRIARAAADVDAATREIDSAKGEREEANAKLASLPSPVPIDVDGALAGAETAHASVRTAGQRLAVAERALDQAREADARLASLRDDVARESVELADWTRLGQDLGKDGIQALEIDAAGPELTAIANDLLHTCVSRRWTIEVRTQRSSADGKKQIEGCDVVVLDTERGREGEAETFSGGERVLIGEALSLALSVLACRRLGVEGPTLVRDESGAALDAANGRAYVAMLRRAAELIGASHVLYVSHTPELQELADARIHVEGGRAVVVA